MVTRMAVLGDGAWGTALALLLAQDPGHRVSLWSAREESGRLLQENRENRKLLPGVPIPESVHLTTSVTEATAGAALWVSAIPTVYLRDTFLAIRGPLLRHGRVRTPVVSVSKGLENETFSLPTAILAELLGAEELAVLSGPSHAEEVSRGLPTSVVAASTSAELALRVQRHFSTERFRVYTNPDPVGVELAGALKNVIAIAAGISDGLGFGDNARSALLTRGLAEMKRFGVAFGADPETFNGLAGVGDLMTTCTSRHGRNRLVGERLARGERPAEILAGMTKVAEGVFTARSVHERAARLGIEMPITSEVYRVLYEGKAPQAAVSDLMLRSPTEERWPR
jgi:glycerol-3-phosphate dehydrogenase (NAD(P)+)